MPLRAAVKIKHPYAPSSAERHEFTRGLGFHSIPVITLAPPIAEQGHWALEKDHTG